MMGLFGNRGKSKPAAPPPQAEAKPEAKAPPANAAAPGAPKAAPKGAQPTMLPNLSKVKNIIAVASGKGGVGKSTTTVNLAYALHQAGAKVAILDADIYGPSIPKMITVDQGTDGAVDGLIVPPVAAGVKAMSIGMFEHGQGPQILRGPMAGNVMKQLMTQVEWGELDYLLIDYPPGTGDIQLTISQTVGLTGAVIVTTPQEVALLDVRKAVGMFKTLKVPVLGVVETMSHFLCEGENKKHFIFGQGGGQRLADEMGVKLLAEVPLHADVVSGADAGKPIVLSAPENPVAKAFAVAAGELKSQTDRLEQATDDGLASFELQWRND